MGMNCLEDLYILYVNVIQNRERDDFAGRGMDIVHHFEDAPGPEKRCGNPIPEIGDAKGRKVHTCGRIVVQVSKRDQAFQEHRRARLRIPQTLRNSFRDIGRPSLANSSSTSTTRPADFTG
jgi:hypothetical protein